MTVAPAMMSDVTWVAVDSDCPNATINMDTNDAMDSQNLRLVSLRFQSILFIVKILSFLAFLGKIKHGTKTVNPKTCVPSKAPGRGFEDTACPG